MGSSTNNFTSINQLSTTLSIPTLPSPPQTTPTSTIKMQFTILASLLAASGLVAASPLSTRAESPCPVVKQGDYVWKISEFSGRKPEGKDYNRIGFNIKATNEGTLDFDCSVAADKIEDGKFYQCDKNDSSFSFAFNSDRSGLLLKQKVSDEVTWIGTTTVPNYCRAGGNGQNDRVCTGVSDAYVTLVEIPIKA